MQELRHPVHAVTPAVSLVAYTADPFGIAVASARTCYAADFVFVGQLTPKGERTRMTLLDALPEHKDALDRIGDPAIAHEDRLALVEALQADIDDVATRDAVAVFADLARQRAPNDERIARSIFEAGHHTPFQHPTFVFALEGVSRNVVESFFHNHTFYNSEQQSQRYVEMKQADVVVPASVASDAKRRDVFDAAIGEAWAAYDALSTSLVERNQKVMGAIGRIKGQTDAQIKSEAKKKSQEMARYVIPIAAATKLYHTVSGIVLLRYKRMAEATNAGPEAKAVVDAMIEAVRQVAPDFVENIEAEPHARDALPEWKLTGQTEAQEAPAGRRLKPHENARLVRATEDAKQLVLDALREVTGSRFEDNVLLQQVLDPAINAVWNDTLNTWDHSPALRSLRHVHYTFLKRQSLTAVAQDQRHRMTPGTRPLLQRLVTPAPDVYTPDVIESDEDALATYAGAIEALWSAMHQLIEMGTPIEDAAYLLPNATNQYYTQSGDLLSYIHKWRLRLCFNAQKEIFEAALDELRQVQAVHPELTQWLGPPCSFVAARQPEELQDNVDACCPEGPRWCGVKVWRGFDAAAGKPKRPY